MLLDASRDALRDGDAPTAVALAEELLDEEPDDVEALRIVADAAPRYGHAEVGLLAARHARARGADVGALEAAALLAGCEVERALEAADDVLRTAHGPSARAHAVRAQALELLGRTDEAEAAYAAAHAARPDAYPRPLAVPADVWDNLLLAALAALPDVDRDLLRRVEIAFADVPDLRELGRRRPPPNPTNDSIFHDLDPDADAASEPLRITLFRRNLARGAATIDDVVRRIGVALQDELDALERTGDR